MKPRKYLGFVRGREALDGWRGKDSIRRQALRLQLRPLFVGKPSPFPESAKATHMSPDHGPAAHSCLSAGPDAIAAHENTKIFPESTFFTEIRAAALPKPDEIRAINNATGEFRATLFNRPLPVKLESLGLFVKYGADVGPVEAQTQVMVREKLQGRVPVPEV